MFRNTLVKILVCWCIEECVWWVVCIVLYCLTSESSGVAFLSGAKL